jgi:hypothetical protein
MGRPSSRLARAGSLSDVADAVLKPPAPAAPPVRASHERARADTAAAAAAPLLPLRLGGFRCIYPHGVQKDMQKFLNGAISISA